MTRLLPAFRAWFGAFFRSRHDLGLELAALRQQVGVLKRQNPRPKLSRWDRLFWMTLRRLWSRWARLLVIVKPETVVSWHRAGFRWYWRFLSRHRPGRPKITSELQKLIRSMATENPTWGAPRIYGELLKLGLEISECTVSRYLDRSNHPRDSGKRWLTFLKHHREAMAAMDFFTVATATFQVLYCFFVISQDRSTCQFAIDTLDRDLLKRFDQAIGRKGYRNRSEAIRNLIREHLVQEDADENRIIVGTLTMVYDHHRPGLSGKLIEAQHHAATKVLAGTHVHLDHENCLEVVIMKGRSGEVRRLGDHLLGLRGVKHGRLVVSSTGKNLM